MNLLENQKHLVVIGFFSIITQIMLRNLKTHFEIMKVVNVTENGLNNCACFNVSISARFWLLLIKFL